MSDLRLGWATHAAAKLACEKWHYSGVLPTGKLVKIGVWEESGFVGVVIYSRGASPYLGRKFDLDHTEVCELTRIALREHQAPVSRIISVSLRLLRESNPGLRVAVSFADPAQGHHGGVYQAAGWIYTGMSSEVVEYLVRGRWRHVRGSYHEQKALGGAPTRTRPPKHRYAFPLDREMRGLLELIRQPYPRAAVPEGDSPRPAGKGVQTDPAAPALV